MRSLFFNCFGGSQDETKRDQVMECPALAFPDELLRSSQNPQGAGGSSSARLEALMMMVYRADEVDLVIRLANKPLPSAEMAPPHRHVLFEEIPPGSDKHLADLTQLNWRKVKGAPGIRRCSTTSAMAPEHCQSLPALSSKTRGGRGGRRPGDAKTDRERIELILKVSRAVKVTKAVYKADGPHHGGIISMAASSSSVLLSSSSSYCRQETEPFAPIPRIALGTAPFVALAKAQQSGEETLTHGGRPLEEVLAGYREAFLAGRRRSSALGGSGGCSVRSPSGSVHHASNVAAVGRVVVTSGRQRGEKAKAIHRQASVSAFLKTTDTQQQASCNSTCKRTLTPSASGGGSWLTTESTVGSTQIS